MASNCCGRRLSELLREQQEPFLVHSRSVGQTQTCRWRLRGAKAVRKALLWDLAGCFSCDTFFRRLPRSADNGGDGDRQLSPVSVLQLHSDEESTEISHWDEEEDSKPSTSPSTDHSPKNGAKEVQDRTKFQTLSSLSKTDEEQAIVSAWERIAADIARIPRLLELDLSASARE
ncbi:hypothetical protein QOZ80_5BG0448160 [Eleusine coracana subsp. coracana]|nr:hypothetical protein QOZ80_5BG0448160 [Eleusine coracana subsp. coracana]